MNRIPNPKVPQRLLLDPKSNAETPRELEDFIRLIAAAEISEWEVWRRPGNVRRLEIDFVAAKGWRVQVTLSRPSESERG